MIQSPPWQKALIRLECLSYLLSLYRNEMFWQAVASSTKTDISFTICENKKRQRFPLCDTGTTFVKEEVNVLKADL